MGRCLASFIGRPIAQPRRRTGRRRRTRSLLVAVAVDVVVVVVVVAVAVAVVVVVVVKKKQLPFRLSESPAAPPAAAAATFDRYSSPSGRILSIVFCF